MVDHDVTGDTSKDVTQTYHYPGAGQPHPHSLTSVTTTGGARDGQTDSYTYDDDGNTKTRQIGSSGAQQQPEQDFVWDLQGQLSSVTKGGQTTSFIYDADGNRLIQHAPDANTLYLAGQEIRLATGTTSPVCTRYYSFGDQTIASRTASGLTWLVSDQHGTAEVSVGGNAAQAVTHRRFTPFGQARGTQPTTWQGTRGFIGGTIDTALGGLTQLGAREYDPGTGRFLSVDPIFDGGDPQSWDGYTYVDNNPMTDSDPSGLDGPLRGNPNCYYANVGCGKPKPSTPSSPPPPQHHCGWTCNVGNFWEKHKAVIVNVTVTIVVTAGCEAVTEGGGGYGCLVVGGMAGNYAGYLVATPPDQRTLGGAVTAEAVGGLQGAAGGVVGKATGKVLGKLADTAGGRAVTKLTGKAGSKAEAAAAKATPAGEDAAEAGSGAAPKAGAKGGAPHESHGAQAAVSKLRGSGQVGAKRNIAAVEVSLEGQDSYTLSSVSGDAERAGTVPSVGSEGNPQRFLPRATGSNTRFSDTEFKLLNSIANRLGPSSESITGRINLHSELPLCPSCRSVVSQFSEAFPGIDLNVTTG